MLSLYTTTTITSCTGQYSLDLMTLTHKQDLGILVALLCSKMKFLGQGFEKLEHK